MKSEAEMLREALVRALKAMQGAKILTQGPSFEAQDTAMCDLLDAIRYAKSALADPPAIAKETPGFPGDRTRELYNIETVAGPGRWIAIREGGPFQSRSPRRRHPERPEAVEVHELRA